MRVKRLEVHGFKSFKDKTVIHFDHGITGIVGPNGCGKSNIVDAFFWVMGEQSYKHIRGSGSDDLIFNGSSKYAPLGYAEATLVVETNVVDTENAPAGASFQDLPVHLRAKEVSVTRRVYRSGEGEYFINGVQARLKDIQELFMDTGVGAKGYSVIEQGQIGKIVNAKPEERRLLIEEAAGIAKYKARKKESLRKMEATQANLSRLNDVIQEIERSLNSLERQAQKARLYKRYKDELIEKEMTWGRRKIRVLRRRLEVLRRDKEALEQELTGLRAELQVVENSIEVDRVTQLTDTKQAEDLQNLVQKISDDLTHERSALDLSKKRQTDLATQLENLRAEKSSVQMSVTEEQSRLQERLIEADQSELSFQDAAAQAHELDQKVGTLRAEEGELRRGLDQTKRELMNGITRSSDLTSKSASLVTRAESARNQVQRLEVQIQAQAEKISLLVEEAEKFQSSLEELGAKRKALSEERRRRHSEIQQQESELSRLGALKNEALAQLTQLRSKHQSLEELEQTHEGFGEGTRAALSWAKDQGQADRLRVIADLLEAQTGFEGALEGWLENRLEDLIAQEVDVAVQAVEHVRVENEGRIAVQVYRQASISAENFSRVRASLEAAGFEVLGELKDFIKINGDEKTAEMAVRALADVCVVRDFAPITAFIGAQGYSRIQGWSLVGLDGNALDAWGTLRGGSIEAEGEASLLRRKRAIAELKLQIQESERVFENAENAFSDSKGSLDQSRNQLQGLIDETQALEIQIAALERDFHQSGRSLSEARVQGERIQREREDLNTEIESTQSEQERIQAQVLEIAESRAALENEVLMKEAALKVAEEDVRKQEQTLQTLRIEEASLRVRTVSLKRELESSRALIQDREKRLTEIDRTLMCASREQENFSGGESAIELKIEERVRALGGSKQELALVRDQIEQSNARVNQALEKIKELHKEGEQKNSDLTQLALEIEKLNSDQAHLVQNLEEKYGPGCLELPQVAPIQEEMEEPVITAEMTAEEEQVLGEEVERLRERIRRLGEVNVMAIEEFEEFKKRYDHLTQEKGDLEHSIKNLQDAIEHINKTSEDRFKKAFDAIADRFEKLFPIIFGGGQASLSLVYPEGSQDILESGVDILAQPPGKKIVNITLLSGGEKALTAVSLIFAIFLVKPSPFCVLDEVDAPLDDANIGKFNALLREMSVKSQFILITHNKKTMELNDTLYGVTMEEPGVSKMVSIEMK